MIESIDEIIKSGNTPSVLLMFGEEELLIEESLHRLIKHLCPTENDLYNFDSVSADEVTQDVAANICAAFPMMGDRRVVVVKNFDKYFSGRAKKADKASPMTRYILNPSPSTVLILIAELDGYSGKQKDKSKKFESAKPPFNTIFEKHEWIEFSKIYESNYSSWVVQRVKKAGKLISPEAAELLVAQNPPSLRDLSNEIQKLCIYADSKKEISLDDVTAVSGSSRSHNVFELQKAVGDRNLKKSLTILTSMLAHERQEMLIITMLTRYFKIIWKIVEESAKYSQNAQIAGAVGVSPYFVGEYINASKKYRPSEINDVFVSLCEADFLLKSSGGDSLFIMQNLLNKIMKK